MKSKKEKSKIGKLIEKSDSDNEEDIHELSYYVNDRVKLMKEVLKIIKPKKIKSMAPECIRDLDIEELNSMLLEELLGISNKRLKYIFNGQNLDEDSSSTDPEEEKQPIDIISLDDVSDDDFVIDVDSVKSKRKKHAKVKQESKGKKIKKEKDKKTNKLKEAPLQEENLMSVLELLELQARARAIRSQLMLEASKKNTQQTPVEEHNDSDNDDVIIEIPKNEEIVITSSDSETEQPKDKNETEPETQKKKIKLIRDRLDKQKSPEPPQDKENVEQADNSEPKDASNVEEANKNSDKVEEKNDPQPECTNDDDEIILIVDQEEMDGIIND
ncbi:DNA ligase 1 isoform X1 [Tribolium castaneum]|uniref:DNA ligase 1 isoform X1 n=1 Tax=Tribolium castaneum TaxID=7070 RepID=UPI0000D5581E|nr:PREDICTED: DNA ligase 1 isoform X1 [Tribolium castaneum]|eukprot:XP_008190353.1 PREDICTED: DNA ligase 1 isoform X1 [Tribolium castaneum]